MKNEWKSLGVVCALVIGVYACMAQSGVLELLDPNPADAYYNLLVQGFRAGHLSLKKEVPSGLAQLADPYDPAANDPYPVLDLSYYKGKFYLYFGVTPALILFWPFVALTGHYLSHRLAVLVFCTTGFLASVGILYVAWRRYFSDVSVRVVAAGALALGLATVVPVMLTRSSYNQVPISCGYMLTMLALGAVWAALHEPERRRWWLAAASVAYGLAVGARPSLLFGAFILLVPVIHARREGQRAWTLLVAAIAPITLIGLGLMLYNALRFDSPFESGLHFQLAGLPSRTYQYFRPRFFWFNFRVYFLEPARWSARFPYVHKIAVPPLPVGYAQVEFPFGVLTNIPFVCLAALLPLAWRGRSGQEASTLRWFAAAVAWLFLACALPLGFFSSAIIRYEVDFAPALVLLAVVGLLGLERALAPTSELGLSNRPSWRRVVRCGWSVLLGFSVAFNLLAGVVYYAETQDYLGNGLLQVGRGLEAFGHYQQALWLNPNSSQTHYDMGVALARAGRMPEAIAQYEQALRINPDLDDAHNRLGVALARVGRLAEAIVQYEQALRIKPDYAEAHYNLGNALAQTGKIKQAIAHYQQALRIDPRLAEAHNSLGTALYLTGKQEEAIEHYQQALRIKPDYAEAHFNLGLALEKMGRTPEAIEHYQQALKLRPDFAPARNALTRLQAGQ